jgi:hypothetical protein
MSYITISHCGNDHLEWLKSIDFYEDEFGTLEKRLMEIADKNSGQEVMAEVEHFQNQFIVQRNNIDELRHSIREHAGKVSVDAKEHAGKMETYLIGEHGRLKDQFDIFEKVIKDFRHEFNLFLAKWM